MSLRASDEIIGSFDIDRIDLITLLYQTGYLTIKSIRQRGPKRFYILGYPNLEVKMSLTDHILGSLTQKSFERHEEMGKLYDAMKALKINSLKGLFHSFFASIPYEWYRKNRQAHFEGYYASIFYTYFTALGLQTIPEDITNVGRIDLSIIMEQAVFIFEFKVIKNKTKNGIALKQLKNKKYHEKYLSLGLPIYLLGIEFEPEKRNIIHFEWVRINPSKI